MNWSSAAIAAGAAIAASALTGAITLLVTRMSLARNSTDLGTRLDHERGALDLQIKHERFAAREDRDQERRKDAYVSLLKFVFWLQYNKYVRLKVAIRGMDGVRAIRMENDWKRTPESAQAERDSFFSAKPTDGEQKELDAAPTSEERAVTNALVTAVASDAVLRAFDELLSKDGKFDSSYVGLGYVLMQEPEPPPAVDEFGADAARRILEDVEKFNSANMALVQASDEFHAAVKEIRQLVRSELNHPPSA